VPVFGRAGRGDLILATGVTAPRLRFVNAGVWLGLSASEVTARQLRCLCVFWQEM